MVSRLSAAGAFLALLLFSMGFVALRPPEKLGKVVFFLSTDCPVAAKYTPRYNELFDKYGEQFDFRAYFPNMLETRPTTDAYCQERGFKFIYELDRSGLEAKKNGVHMVPTVAVFDKNGNKVYQGAVDDNMERAKVKEKYVETVLEDLKSGKEVSFHKTEAMGCVIMASAPTPPDSGKVTYAEHIAPLLNRSCVECHRPGEIGPFSLTGYDNARKWAENMVIATKARRMPPWKAEPGYGEFFDENRLTDEEISTLRAWAKDGCPRGDKDSEPEPPKFSSEWPFGEPDVVFQNDKPFKLEAEGADVYRNFVFKTDYKEPVYVTAMAIKPGNAKIVHHVIGFVDTSGAAIRKNEQAKDGQDGYITFGGPGFNPDTSFGGWAPGYRAPKTPPGTAFLLKPGGTVVMQVHYHKSGKAEQDQTKMGLYFSKEPPKQVMQLAWLANPFFKIPPGAKHHDVQLSFTVPADVTVYGAMPHMHLLGKEMRARAVLPDGTEKPFVHITDWDFRWQMSYPFKDPIKLPKGAKIIASGYFDNSAENPNQPNDPPKQVGWGEETTDEMFLLVVPFTVDNQFIGK